MGKRDASETDDSSDEHKMEPPAKRRAPDKNTKQQQQQQQQQQLAPIFAPSSAPLPPLKDNQLQGCFNDKHPGSLTLATWNVCGMRSVHKPEKKHPFRKYVEAEDPDIIVVTEVNQEEASKDPSYDYLRRRFKTVVFSRKYVAVFSKLRPRSIRAGLPDWSTYGDPDDMAARVLTLEFDKIYVVATYVRNAGTACKNLPLKLSFLENLGRYIHELDAQKPVIWSGDFNAVVDQLDLEVPQMTWNREPGAHVEERRVFADVLEPEEPHRPLVDVWRYLHGNDREWTHWNGRTNGWRIDGFVVSSRLMARVRQCEIRHAVRTNLSPRASDHWPVFMELVENTLEALNP